MSLQIQLKKSAVSQKQPFASDLAVGELALNYNADGPFLTCKDSAGNIRKLNHVWVAATSPTAPKAGDQWLDISSATAVLKVYKDSSSTWVNATTVPLATTSIYGTVQLASSADVANGTSGKIVDAAQLQSKVTTEITSALSANPLQLNSLQVSNNTVINGDLTVNGTTTTIDTTTLVVEDKNIEMGAFDVPTDSTANGGGIILQGTTNKSITWNNSTDAWTSSERLDLPAGTAASPSLIFNGDVNSGVYSPGADQLAISTGGTGRLFIDANGGVGINTNTSFIESIGKLVVQNGSTTADERLVVAANAYLSGPTFTATYLQQGDTATTGTTFGLSKTNLGALVFQNTSAGLIGCNGGVPLVFGTSGLERMRLDSSGHLGVGTNTVDPNHIFQANGVIASVTPFGAFSALQTAGGTGFRWTLSNDGTYRLQRTTDGFSTVTTPIYVDANSRTGIGTTSPSSILDVGGTVTVKTADKFIQFNDGTNDVARLTYAGTGEFVIDANGPSTQSTQFWIGGSEKARIDNAGRLLVGNSTSVTTPVGAPPLQVITGQSIIRYSSDGTFPASIDICKSKTDTTGSNAILGSGDEIGWVNFAAADGSGYVSSARVSAQVDGTPGANTMPGKLVFSTTSATPGTSPAARMTIKADGKVGIGTTSPGEALEVAGDISVSPNPGGFRVIGAGLSSDTTLVLQGGGASGTGGNIELGRSGDTIYDATIHRFRTVDGTSEYARIDDVGRLLVGTSSANQVPTGEGANRQPYFQVGSNTYESSALSSILFAPDAIGGGSLSLARSNTSTVGDQALANSGDVAGSVFFSASDGAKQVRCAQIVAQIDGTPNTDDMPGRLVLYTTAAGANTPTEQMRITSDSVRVYNQPAPIAINASTTATIGDLKNGIITSSGAATVTITLPTGTACDGGFGGLYGNMTFQWSVINTSATVSVVIAANTGHALLGLGTIGVSGSGRFATRRTGLNTWVSYRLAS